MDRRKKGSKHHILTDGHGVPLAATTTAANVNDVTQLRGLVERSRRYAASRVGLAAGRTACMATGAMTRNRSGMVATARIEPFLAARYGAWQRVGGVYRWVVERTLSWLHAKRKLRVRTDRRIDIHQAYLSLACSLVCLIFL